MMFKNFLREVWLPMQQQAKARGMNPADVDVSGALNNYIGSQAMGQVGTDIREAQTGLAERRLGEAKDVLKSQKKIAPWATGLGVANVGLQGVMGWNERTRLQNRRKQFDEFMQTYIQQNPGRLSNAGGG